MRVNKILNESFELDSYTYEDAIDQARMYIKKRGLGTEMLILQKVDDEFGDQYNVINADAYMRWSMGGRSAFEIVARVDRKGVTEL